MSFTEKTAQNSIHNYHHTIRRLNAKFMENGNLLHISYFSRKVHLYFSSRKINLARSSISPALLEFIKNSKLIKYNFVCSKSNLKFCCSKLMINQINLQISCANIFRAKILNIGSRITIFLKALQNPIGDFCGAHCLSRTSYRKT